ncbi:MAG: energy transducer TonB [Thermoanaerobaculia bacterium]
MRTGLRLLAASFLFPILLGALPAAAQTTGVQVVKEVKPVYPEQLQKQNQQGNVLLIGRIDKAGKLQDVRALAASNELFVGPAIAAVKNWEFRPARRNGKPIEIAANIGFRFRLQTEHHGQIPREILSNIAVFPADASGKKTGEEGFPIRRGSDARLRAEAVLDIPPPDHEHEFPVRVEAISPSGKRIVVYEDRVDAPPKAKEMPFSVTAKIGSDWEDGVWMLRFFVEGADAGGGQFWLAGDPDRFNFAAAMPKN